MNKIKEIEMLSIVVALRNDDHGGDQAHRVGTFLHVLGALSKKHGLAMEIIAVEWNPPLDRPPLKEMLAWPDSARIITVPPGMHRRYKNSAVLDFYQMIAKNVGIRRAKGDWILATNPDVVFSNNLIAYLATAELDPGNLYRAFRHDLGVGHVEGDTVSEILDFCRRNVATVHSQKFMGLHTHACGDFTMLHRAAWEDLRGYPEFDLWSIHIDSVLMAMAQAAGYKEVVLSDSCRVYHIEHGRSWVVNPELAERYPSLSAQKGLVPLFNHMQQAKMPLQYNKADWGFGDEILKES
jgi:hypothetical protein